MPTPVACRTSLARRLAAVLAASGFSADGQVMRRVADGVVQVVEVQGAPRGGMAYIAVGTQPLGLGDVLGRAVDQASIREIDCLFRGRIGAGWPYHEAEDDWSAEVAAACSAVAADGFLDRHGSLTALASLVGDGSAMPAVAGIALVHARVARLLGLDARARRLAEHGLRLAPARATVLIAQLEGILAG